VHYHYAIPAISITWLAIIALVLQGVLHLGCGHAGGDCHDYGGFVNVSLADGDKDRLAFTYDYIHLNL
jgi:hypothetical protein